MNAEADAEAVEVRGVHSVKLGRVVLGRSTVLLVLGALVGLVVGAVTVAYRHVVHWGNSFLLEKGPLAMEGSWYLRLLFPAAGGLLVGLLLRRYYSQPHVYGIPSVIRAVQRNRVLFPWTMLYPSLGSVVILSSGGSAGPEGPIAEIGSVFGAKIGRLFRVHRRMYRTLVAAGVAAGISAIFSAPIGGVLFALEVILLEFELVSFAPVVIASVVASLFCQAAFGQEPAIRAGQFQIDHWEIPYFVLLGLAMGLLSLAYIRFLDFSAYHFKRIPLPRWVLPALGGLLVGCVGIPFYQVMGEGYGFINTALAGRYPATILLALLVAKFLATGITLGSGAPGGSFAPALFVGAMGGCLLGRVFHAMSPGVVGEAGMYGLMGMAGMIAGAFNAPMTAIMIFYRETHGEYHMLLPLMTTVAFSIAVMSRWGNVSLYTNTLRKLGEWIPPGQERDPLYGLVVGDILSPRAEVMPAHVTVAQAMARMNELDAASVVVEDDKHQYVGLVNLDDLRLALADPMMENLITLGDVVDPTLPWLEPNSSLSDAIRVFASSRREALPVFEDSPVRNFVGIVSRGAVIDAYRDSRIETPQS